MGRAHFQRLVRCGVHRPYSKGTVSRSQTLEAPWTPGGIQKGLSLMEPRPNQGSAVRLVGACTPSEAFTRGEVFAWAVGLLVDR